MGVGTVKAATLAHLAQRDPRYPAIKIEWAVDAGADAPISVLMRALLSDHEHSATRTTDASLVEIVTVDVRGPGPDALSTATSVHNKGLYLYRTDRFLLIESRMISLLQAEAIALVIPPAISACNPPCLATLYKTAPSRVDTTHGILRQQPKSGALLARIMLAVNIQDVLTKKLARPHDRNALMSAQVQHMQDIRHLLLYAK